MNSKTILLVVVMAAVVFSMPLLLRQAFQDGLPFGEDTYNHYLISQVAGSDITPYHEILVALDPLIGIELASQLLGIVLGILSALVFFLLLRRLGVTYPLDILSVILFLTLPTSVYLFSASNPASMAVFMILLSFYLFLSHNPLLKMLSIALSFSVLLFGALPFLLSALLLVSSIFKSRKQQILFSSVLSLTVFSAWLYGIISPTITFGSMLSDIVADFGGLFGLGIFHILLASIGILVLWPQRFIKPIAYLSLLYLLAALGILGSSVVIYSAFTIAFFSAVAINALLTFKWESAMVKRLTFIVLFCGILFSTISYAHRIATLEPNPEIVDSLEWLGQQPAGNVISHASNGFWIQYFSRQKTIDSSNSSVLFATRNLGIAKGILNAHNVEYIWIDPAMKRGEVWQGPQQGLLFLFRNNETFKKLDERFGIETWQYIGAKNGEHN